MCNTFKNCEGLSQVAFLDGNGMAMSGKVSPCKRKEDASRGGKRKRTVAGQCFSRRTCCISPQRLPTRAEMRSCKWHYLLRCLLFDSSAGELHMHSLPNTRTDRWAHVHGDLAASFFCTLLAAAR